MTEDEVRWCHRWVALVFACVGLAIGLLNTPF